MRKLVTLKITERTRKGLKMLAAKQSITMIDVLGELVDDALIPNEITLLFDMRSARESGYVGHPSKVMADLGFTVLNSEPSPIGDCWFFKVKQEEYDRCKPKPFLTVSAFRFSDQ